MEKRFTEVLRRGLKLVNALDGYPQERELLIKSISILKEAMRKYVMDKTGNYEETYRLLGRTNALMTQIEQTTILEEVDQLESFVTLLESEEVESLVTIFGRESVEIMWPVLTEDLPEGVPHGRDFYETIC